MDLVIAMVGESPFGADYAGRPRVPKETRDRSGKLLTRSHLLRLRASGYFIQVAL
jgi:hypothetical protein